VRSVADALALFVILRRRAERAASKDAAPEWPSPFEAHFLAPQGDGSGILLKKEIER
jgi:hypothetical protein